MKILHIGGIADGESHDLHDNVGAGRQSFKRSTDFPGDPLLHHDYVRRMFTLCLDEKHSEERELMVWNGLADHEAAALVGARLGRTDLGQISPR